MGIIDFEVPKELADRVYQLIEKARNGGKIRKGANEVTKSIERGESQFVIVAADVNPIDVVLHLPVISAEKSIPFITVPSKTELGAAAGLPVGTAAIGIVDAGEGKKAMQDIAKSIQVLKPKKEEKKEEPKEEPKEEEKPKKAPKKAEKEPEAKEAEEKEEKESE